VSFPGWPAGGLSLGGLSVGGLSVGTACSTTVPAGLPACTVASVAVAFAVSAGPVPAASAAAAATLAALGRLRTDSRVAASMNATPSAASPASCASMTGVPIGIALEFATRRATSLLLPWLLPFGAGVGTADELTVGNSPDALPPELRLVEPAPPIVGRLPTGSGEVTPPPPPAPFPGAPPPPLPGGFDVDGAVELGVAGAVTGTPAATAADLVRCAAVSDAVSLTDVTEVAVVGTVTLASTSRAADPEVTVPRLHAAVPFWLPQPKLNAAFWLVGAVASLITTLEALPFCAHTPICQLAAWPRTMLACARCTLTHRLGCGVVAARAWNAVSEAGAVVGVAAVCVVLAVEPEAGGVVVSAELLAGALDVEGGGDDDCVWPPVPDEGGDVDVPLPLGGVVGGVVVGGVVVGGVVVGGVVVGGVVVGGGVVGGGVVDTGTFTSWHCQTTGELVTVPPAPSPGIVVAAMLIGANAALAAKPAVAVKSVPPAMRPIATGRTRAKHM
jgi:hypothetical protein